MILVRTMRFFLQAAQPVPLKGANDIPCRLVTPIQAVGDLLRSIAVSAQPHDGAAAHDEAGFGLSSLQQGGAFLSGQWVNSVERFHEDEFSASPLLGHIIICGLALGKLTITGFKVACLRARSYSFHSTRNRALSPAHTRHFKTSLYPVSASISWATRFASSGAASRRSDSPTSARSV
jgi:hypothetical protein